jgi:hypothetical protein
MLDCNTNGVPDDQDIALGTSHDCDTNGVPDECEDVGQVVDAGVLAVGTIVGGRYDSTLDGNHLEGRVCPDTGTPSVLWEYLDGSGPLGVEVFIPSPRALTASYLVEPALAGTYVFRLTWIDAGLSDTVTLTLQDAP